MYVFANESYCHDEMTGDKLVNLESAESRSEIYVEIVDCEELVVKVVVPTFPYAEMENWLMVPGTTIS